MTKENNQTKNKKVFTYHHPAGFTQDVVFVVARYTNSGNLYVGLLEAENGMPFTYVTTNFTRLSPGLAYIKNVDENDGMVQFLLDNEMGTLCGGTDDNYPLFLFDLTKLPPEEK